MIYFFGAKDDEFWLSSATNQILKHRMKIARNSINGKKSIYESI